MSHQAAVMLFCVLGPVHMTLGCSGICFVFQTLSMWHWAAVVPVLCLRSCPFDIWLVWYLFSVPGTFPVTMDWCDIYFAFQALSMSHWDAVVSILCSSHFYCYSRLLWYLFLCYKPCPFDIGSVWCLFYVPGTFLLTLSYYDIYFVFQALSCHIGLLWYLFVLLGLSTWHWVCIIPVLCSRYFSYNVGIVWNFLFQMLSMWHWSIVISVSCSRRCPCHIGLLQYLLSTRHTLWSWPLGLSSLCVLL